MEELSKEIPNLFVIDYDRCYESIDDQGKNIYVDFETCCLAGSIDKVDLAFIQKITQVAPVSATLSFTQMIW